MRGIQPVLYGYFISSLIYFYGYAHSKIAMKEYFYAKQKEGDEENQYK